MSTVYIENLGCAKNQVDAEIIGARMEEAGWTWTDEADRADLIIVNTCGFIEPAQQESIDTTLALLADHPGVPVALAGCMAQRYAGELADGMPELAGVFGNREPHRIIEFLDRLNDGDPSRGPVVWVPDGAGPLVDAPRRRLLSGPGSAFLKVAEGCDHTCSFCAIPSIRGRLRVRSRTSVLDEFRRLRDSGVWEFNLVAQDLAAWNDATASGAAGEADTGTGAADAVRGADTGTDAAIAVPASGFTSLVRTLLTEPGEFWIRPLYLYPDTFPRELLHLAADDRRLLSYFDLSFQHAAPSVLRRMGRPGTPERYLSLIEEIREILPDAALRSSFIVGFPGETDEDVEILLDFLKAARLEWVGVFEFSPQDGTPAGAMQNTPAPEVATDRRTRIEALQETIVAERLQRFVGRELPVIVEDRIQGTAIALGRSPLQAPEVDGLVVVHDAPPDLRPGDRAGVTVTGVTGVDLQGTFLPRRGA
ncbi:MAG: 30S ribosomal protein S12 methylthiotransferase RimO [Alkalispirochaeta sp.]